MGIGNFIKDLLRGGLKITISSGKPFDPRYQKRTDPIKDIIEAESKRKEKNEHKK